MFDNIPKELKLIPQWVNYNNLKIPISPQTGRPAQSNNKETWSSFAKAETRAKACGLGVGFVFTENDPYIFVDFDKVEDHEKAHEEIKLLDGYTEVSPSGKGYHVIITGNSDLIRNNKSKCKKYEVYKKGRYATFTGDVVEDRLVIKESKYFDKFYKKYIEVKKEPKQETTIPLWIESKEHDITNNDIDSMLKSINSDCDYDTWLKIGMALKSHHVPSGVFESWSATGSKYKKGEPSKKFKSFKKADIKIGTLIHFALDNGWTFPEKHIDEVDLSFLDKKKEIKKEKITSADIRKIVNNSILKPFIEQFEQVMIPSLPMELTLGKTLVLLGMATSGITDNSIIKATAKGNRLSKVRIGGEMLGIPPNFYCINVAESGSGKDIGGLFNKICFEKKWYVPTGSPEGVMDCLSNKSVGCVTISEMQNFFDQKRWENKLNSFLTQVYNEYMFDVATSKRQKDAPKRNNDYCSVNIMGNIQPKILKAISDSSILDNGFLGRCILFITPQYETNYCVPNENMKDSVEKLIDILTELQNIEGQFAFNQQIVIETIQKFASKNMPYSTLWRRLFNETVKKLAFIFSINTKTLTIDKISDQAINDAIVFCKWIYFKSLTFYSAAEKDQIEKKFDVFEERVFEYIKQKDRTQSEITSRFQAYKKHYNVGDIINNLILNQKIKIKEIKTKTKPKNIFTIV